MRLWENGPKWAEYNVGVTDGNPKSDGGHYRWGNPVDCDPSKVFNEGTGTLAGNDDTATAIWGKNWRMPSYDELRAILDNCIADRQRDGVYYHGVTYAERVCGNSIRAVLAE